MSKVASAAAFSFLLLAACGGGEPSSTHNGAADAEANAAENGSSSAPGQPGAPVDSIAEPVPPPDAVSHPDGYLPPAPADAEPTKADSPESDESPPATEDEYMRNKQAGR